MSAKDYMVVGIDNGLDIYKRCLELAENSDCEKMKFGSIILAFECWWAAVPETDAAAVYGEGYNHKVSDVLKNFNCCELRKSIPSGMRTEFCGAIHAETMALQEALANGAKLSECVLYVAGLNGDESFFDNSKGFYCLPCAKELYHAGIKKIALASADTPKTGKWVYVTIEEALRQSLEFTKGTKIVGEEESIVKQASKIVATWSDSKRVAWEQRTGLKLAVK